MENRIDGYAYGVFIAPAPHKNMIRALKIETLLNGFTVQCGCQRLAYTSTKELLKDLGDYLKDPEATEKRILVEKGFNRKHTLADQPVQGMSSYPSAMLATDICSMDEHYP